jgi:hypothetical protein
MHFLAAYRRISTAGLELQSQETLSTDAQLWFVISLLRGLSSFLPRSRAFENNRQSPSAATFQSMVESLSWSPYLEECLKVLEDAKETPGDDLLVHFIKLQRIASKATTIRVQMKDADSEESTRIIGPYVSMLNNQLAAVKSLIPVHLSTNSTSKTYLLLFLGVTAYSDLL